METLGALEIDPVGVPQQSRLDSGVLWEHGLFWNPGASKLLGSALGAEGSPDHWEVWKTVRWYFWNLGGLSGRWVRGEPRGSLKGGVTLFIFCLNSQWKTCFSGNFLGVFRS